MRFENKNSRKPKKNIYEKTKSPESLKNSTRANVRLQKEEEKAPVKEFEVNPDSPFLSENFVKKGESDYEKKAKEAVENVVLNEGIVYNDKADEEKVERIKFSLKKDVFKKSEAKADTSDSVGSDSKLEALKNAMNLSEEAIKEEKEEKEKSIEEGMNSLAQMHEKQDENLAIVSDRSKKKEPMLIKFTPLRAVAFSFLLFVGLGTFFGIGIVVGRDMQAKMTPVELPTIALNEEESIAKNEDIILKAEELQYSEQLKSADRDAPIQNSATEVAGNANTTQGITPYPIGDSNTLALEAEKAKQEEAKKIEDSTIYDYVIRTATFKAENKATSFSKKLIANNLRGEVVRGASWYFVNVKFRGTPKNYEEMKAKLLKLGIDDSIILSKEALQLG